MYQAYAGCVHRDAAKVAAFVRSRGTKPKPFFLYSGDKVPRRAQPVQFEGQVVQEVTWQGIGGDGYYSAQLALIYFSMTAEHPEFGRLSIGYDASRPGSYGNLRGTKRGKEFPVVHTTRLNVVALSSALPGVVLQNQGPPLEFISEPTSQWPPENAIYALRVEVDFENRHSRGPVVVTASAGSVLVGVEP